MNARPSARFRRAALITAIASLAVRDATGRVGAQTFNAPGATKISNSGGLMLVGPLSRADLMAAPFSEWFASRYTEYLPSGRVIDELRTQLADVSIEAYFGTWCGDSRRQVPRLLRILSDAGFDERRLTLTGLSDLPMEFKQSPGREETKRRIHRTPTIVLLRGGREIGRIVETPAETLEADLLTLAKGQGPARRYGAEGRVHDLFIDTPAGTFEAALKSAAADISARSNPESLWHYAEFDLLRNGQPAAAKAVLDLYLKTDPSSVQGHVLMAEALNALGRKAEALAAAERALALEPKNPRALKIAISLRPPAE